MYTQIIFLCTLMYLFVRAFKGPYKRASRLSLGLMTLGWGMAIQTESQEQLTAYISAVIALIGIAMALGILLTHFIVWLCQKYGRQKPRKTSRISK